MPAELGTASAVSRTMRLSAINLQLNTINFLVKSIDLLLFKFRATFRRQFQGLHKRMNAYLFTSISTITQLRPSAGSFRQTNTLQTWDTSVSLIVMAENSVEAQVLFEDCIRAQPPDENPMQMEIRKIAGAQFADQLLTESGTEAFDWQHIQQVPQPGAMQSESTPSDSFEDGCWVDADQAVPPGKLSANIGALKHELPQDIGADLNWSADKQFFFVLSVFSPPPPSPAFEPETHLSTPADSLDETPETTDAASSGRTATDSINLRELCEIYPQARDKEAAALIKARNAVVAAWLWRRYAATTHLAANQIRIDPLCDIVGLPEGNDS